MMNTRLGFGSKELTHFSRPSLSAWPERPVSWQIYACTSMDSPKSFTLSAPSSRERPSVFTA